MRVFGSCGRCGGEQVPERKGCQECPGAPHKVDKTALGQSTSLGGQESSGGRPKSGNLSAAVVQNTSGPLNRTAPMSCMAKVVSGGPVEPLGGFMQKQVLAQ